MVSNIPAGTYVKRIVSNTQIELGVNGSRLTEGNTVNALQTSSSTELYFVYEKGIWADTLPTTKIVGPAGTGDDTTNSGGSNISGSNSSISGSDITDITSTGGGGGGAGGGGGVGRASGSPGNGGSTGQGSSGYNGGGGGGGGGGAVTNGGSGVVIISYPS